MEILIHFGYISENEIFMQFHVILPLINEIPGDLPVVSNNHKLLGKLRSDTSRIIDDIRPKLFFLNNCPNAYWNLS